MTDNDKPTPEIFPSTVLGSTISTPRLPQGALVAGSLASTTALLYSGVIEFTGERKTEVPSSDHPIFALVGQVASAAAHLEHTLDLIIWELAGIDHQAGACITAQLTGAMPRYNTIIAQLTLKSRTEPRYVPFIKQTEELKRHTHKPQDERNRIVHDPWYITYIDGPGILMRPTTEKPAQFRAMPQKGLNFGVMEIDMKNIEDTIQAFIALEEGPQS